MKRARMNAITVIDRKKHLVHSLGLHIALFSSLV